MAVRCGYCKGLHDSPEQVGTCGGTTDRRLIRRNTKPEMHPMNKVALPKAHANMAALKALREEPVDAERNQEGIAAARAALQGRAVHAA